MKRILLVGLGLVAALAAVVSMQPATFKVSRSTTIKAPAEKIFPWVAELPKFVEWNPWSHLDPNAKITFAGTPGTVGSSYAWDGNDDVGKGTLTIKEISPNQFVNLDLHFIKPWESEAATKLSLAPKGEEVEVSWSMSGENDFMGKAMSLFMDMDSMIGPDYEKGLRTLKEKVEAAP